MGPRGRTLCAVADSRAPDRVRKRIEAISAESADATALRRDALDALAQVVEFDAYVWLLTDPVTAVGAAPLADVPCLPELPALIKAKYATPVNRWTVLQHAPSPVGLLHDLVEGELARSHVWQEVLSRYEIGDVASAVFADQFGCWGFLDLWRNNRGVPFDRVDADLIADLAPSLTAGLRRCQAETFVEPAAPQPGRGPVVLTLDDDLRITSRTAASQSWLDLLLPPRPDERGIPASVYNVAAQLLAVEAGVDQHPASARVHLAEGFWLTLRAARLASEEPVPATVVVTIEEASAAERLELFARAFGLTARENELLGRLATGDDTRAMAHQMSLSEHTVQDHLKSIFAKTGARDRITVLSRALGTRNTGPGSGVRG
ncbi:MAG: LuxR family transcriptional regulator [Pseudonocardiales bacterium]|nr:LuxR family transcriptional regulator [Pseudonocardiales bacterium]